MSELIPSDIEGLHFNYYLTLISYTILVYEYFLTFAMEVERFWSAGRLTWAVFFFYLNRYFTLFGHIPVVVEYFWSSTSTTKIQTSVLLISLTPFQCRYADILTTAGFGLPPTISCHHLQSYHQYFAVAVQIWVSTLLIMRMYALYDRSRRVLALYLCVAFTIVVVACWFILTGKDKDPTNEIIVPVGCSASLSRLAALRLSIAWGGMLFFDTLVFFMTVYKSLLFRRVSGMNLLTLLLRDGSVYFGVMIASNIANILTFLYGGPFTRGMGTTFTNVISSIMITRLMLNLRDPRLTPGFETQFTTRISTAVFGSRARGASTLVEPWNGTDFTEANGHQHTTELSDNDWELTNRDRLGADVEVLPRSHSSS